MTLPSEIIPSKQVRFCVNPCGSTDGKSVSLVGNVTIGGSLQIFCNGLTTDGLKFWSFSVTYPIEGSVGGSGGSAESNVTFINGVYSASSENDFCLLVAQEFLATGKPHAFINATWDGNDYFTGTASRYASGSCQMMIGRANQSYILKVKSNGTTITVNKTS